MDASKEGVGFRFDEPMAQLDEDSRWIRIGNGYDLAKLKNGNKMGKKKEWIIDILVLRHPNHSFVYKSALLFTNLLLEVYSLYLSEKIIN